MDTNGEVAGLSYLYLTACGVLVRPAGIEPATTSLEGWCSIQLSYGRGDICEHFEVLSATFDRSGDTSKLGISIIKKLSGRPNPIKGPAGTS